MIALVVDSGSQITPELRERLGARVVPLTVTVDGVPHLEGEQIDAAGIHAALTRGAALGTSTPSPGQLLQAYRDAAAAGADAVLSVHTGGAASATAAAAVLAAGMAPLPVEVVDTGSASFPVTLCAWAAADVLAAGGTLQEAAAAARRTAAGVGNVFVVGTLALAERGGRLQPGTTGTPVLALTDGRMVPVGQVADVGAAVEAMTAYVVRTAGQHPLRVGVGHLGAAGLAADLALALSAAVDVAELVPYVVGPSIAVHTGLGTVGCVFCRVQDPGG